MRKLVLILTALIAAIMVPSAFAGGKTGEVYGPTGYSGPPAATTIEATASSAPVLTSGDHVVICHATGGPGGSGFIQIAPSAGVAAGHMGHEGARDIIPPFTINLGKSGNVNTDAQAGQNWTDAGRAFYANGCAAPGTTPPPPPTLTCPEGTDLSSTIENDDGVVTGIVCLKTVTDTETVTVTVTVPGPPVPGPTTTTTVFGNPTCPTDTTEVSRGDGSVVCLKTVTVEKPVTVVKTVVKTKTLVKVKKVVVVKTKVVVKRVAAKAPKPKALPFTP